VAPQPCCHDAAPTARDLDATAAAAARGTMRQLLMGDDDAGDSTGVVVEREPRWPVGSPSCVGSSSCSAGSALQQEDASVVGKRRAPRELCASSSNGKGAQPKRRRMVALGPGHGTLTPAAHSQLRGWLSDVGLSRDAVPRVLGCLGDPEWGVRRYCPRV